MKTQKERLKDFISYLGISARAFEKSIGVSQSVVAQAKDKLSANLIDKTCNTYPILSRIWLLTGEGDMILRTENTFGYNNMPNATNTNICSPGAVAGGDMAEKVAALNATIAEKDDEISELKEQNAAIREENMQLKIENAKLQGMIEILKEK